MCVFSIRNGMDQDYGKGKAMNYMILTLDDVGESFVLSVLT